MSNFYDVVIVGAGCVGASVARELSSNSDLRILVIDEGDIAARATGKSGGMVRVYHQSDDLTDLARESIKSFWGPEFQTTGSFYLVPEGQLEVAREKVRKLKETGYPVDLLTPSEAKKYFPQFDFSFSYVVYEPKAGFASPVSLTRTWIQESMDRGVGVLLRTRLIRIHRRTDSLELDTSAGKLLARTVVLATGAGTVSVLQKHQIRLPMKVKEIRVKASSVDGFLPRQPFYFDYTDLSFAGVRKTAQGQELLSSHAGVPLRLPALGNLSVRLDYHELDSYTEDREGILRFIPAYPGLLVCSGWGGTAFKLSPAIGSRARDLVTAFLHQEVSHVTA